MRGRLWLNGAYKEYQAQKIRGYFTSDLDRYKI